MNCCEFREKYSDFADGLLTSGEHAEASGHLAACAACRRFEAALNAGLNALRSLPRLGVSHGFGARLRHRLRGELAVRVPVAARWSSAVGTLLLVAAVGYIRWDLRESREMRREQMARSASGWHPAPLPLAANAPLPVPSASHVRVVRASFEPFHPLNSILLVAQSAPIAMDGPQRLDLPAVWGGP